jgi:hypothetical protein
MDFEMGVHVGNRHDVAFRLIEITDSTEIERLLTSGRFSSATPGQRLGGVLAEDDLHHYRVTFDDHGTYDVICTDIAIRRLRSNKIDDFP